MQLDDLGDPRCRPDRFAIIPPDECEGARNAAPPHVSARDERDDLPFHRDGNAQENWKLAKARSEPDRARRQFLGFSYARQPSNVIARIASKREYGFRRTIDERRGLNFGPIAGFVGLRGGIIVLHHDWRSSGRLSLRACTSRSPLAHALFVCPQRSNVINIHDLADAGIVQQSLEPLLDLAPVRASGNAVEDARCNAAPLDDLRHRTKIARGPCIQQRLLSSQAAREKFLERRRSFAGPVAQGASHQGRNAVRLTRRLSGLCGFGLLENIEAWLDLKFRDKEAEAAQFLAHR